MAKFNRCMSCMEMKFGTQQCSYCGWVEDGNPGSEGLLAPGTILNEKYLVGRVLGQGGYGITYIAFDLVLNQKLAIKEFFPQDLASRSKGSDEVLPHPGKVEIRFKKGMDKFLEEARILARFCDHPHIIHIRDYFYANSTAYFVMNYVRGVTLKSYLERAGGRISLSRALRVVVPVLDVLEEVHAVGILHRDISPDNIFINHDGQVVLIDFGAACHYVDGEERTLSVILKPDYAPEEQFRVNGKQGPWTDIYAVGATLYHMITGLKPPDALDRLAQDTIVAPSQAAGEKLDKAMEKVMLKALAVRAPERYQDARVFKNELLDKWQHSSTSLTFTITSDFEPYHEERLRAVTGYGQTGSAGMEIAGKSNMQLKDGHIKQGKSDSVFIDQTKQKQPGGIKYIFAEDQKKQTLTLAGLVIFAVLALVLTTVQLVSLRTAPQTPAVNGVNGINGSINAFLPIYGAAVSDDGWIYFSNRSDNSYLYKVREDGTELVKLNSDSTAAITLSGNWVFYINESNMGRIYRVLAEDGRGRSRVTAESAKYLIADTERRNILYFSNQDDRGRIYSVRGDGSGLTRLNDDNSAALYAADGWVYYLCGEGNRRFYRIRYDGTMRTELAAYE